MRKLRHIFTTALMALTLLAWSNVGWGQIISQYTETNSGSSPKGIEIWNNTEATLDFSVNNLDIQKGVNGAALASDILIETGELAPNAVMVIGTSDIETYLTDAGLTDVLFVLKAFTFNGDDALAVIYGGTTTDVFGDPGTGDPGDGWAGNGVQTWNQNIQLLSGITTGDTDGWTDPSLRFETISTDPVNDLTGFGLAPESLEPDTEAPIPTFFPLDGATGVAVDVNPTITFDEAIYDPADGEPIVDADLPTFLTFTDGTDAVPHTATISGNVITVVPDAALVNEQAYTLTIGGVEDEVGNVMDLPANATFTTISAAAETIELTGDYTGPYYAGDDVTVTWNAANFDNVVVEAWVPSENEGAGGWVPMVASTPAVDGTASFTIPADAEYSAEYKLRVADAADGDPVAETAAFTVRAVVSDIASVRALAENDEFRFDGEAIVTAMNSYKNRKFIEDATAAIMIYDDGGVITTPYVVGDGMSGLIGKKTVANEMVRLVPIADPGAPSSNSNPVTPTVLTLDAVTSDDQAKLVTFEMVTFENPGTFANNNNYNLTDGTNQFVFRTDFFNMDYIGEEMPTSSFNVTGVIQQYNSDLQITARDLADFVVFSNDASLATFTLGGLDALGLEGLVVANPEMDEGATLFVDDFTDFAGIDIAATDAATVLVELNGTEVVEGDYATQVLADGDVVVATVTAEDATMAYYKVTLVGDNRELTLTAPTGVQAYETGDDIVFTWTSANIDNVNLYAVDVTKAENLINDEPIDATTGTYTTTVPNGVFGTFYFRIADAVDPSFYSETADASTITDTQAPSADFSYPLMGETDMPTSFTLMVEFDEEIQLATGNLTVHLASDGTVVATLTEADGTVDGNMISGAIEGLAWETEYYINVTEGMIQDLSGNNLPAITDQSWAFTTMVEPTADLFFSEYIEGSSSNKAIEIYNPTGAPVDLTPYEVRQFSNGSSTVNNTEDLTGTLDDGAVFVIANTGADEAILAVADITSNVTFYNGNDAIGLYKDGVLIDIIGLTTLPEPDSNTPAWDVAGVTGATAEHTLVRKSAVVIGNTDWAASAGTNEDDSEWMVFPQNTFTFIGWHGLNNEAEILTFEVDMQMAPATINAEAGTITLEVLNGTDLTTLVPEFTLSMGATAYVEAVEQESGVSVVDFTSPVTYVVEAESGTTKDWTVTITEADVSTEAEIISFSLAEQIGPATIDSEAGTIDITVANGTDVTVLEPTIEISLGATISPESGVAQDFTSPVVYTVTAQDLSTTKEWTVTVTVSEIISIYDIQFTPAPSGESPYADKVVTTTGIVTAQNIAGTNNHGFFIQDGEGAWNGIYIYILSQEGAIMPNLGDEVIVSGTVIEYYEYTEITFPTINVISSDNTIPTPTIISTEDGNNEEWEGVLVKVQNSNTLSGPNAYNEFIINDGSADLVVDDKLFNYLPSGSDPLIVVGSTYNFTGVIDYSFDEYKLLPRFAQDIELASSVSTTWGENITAYPNPFTSTVWIDNAESASRISVVNLIGQQVISITHDGSNRAMIPTNDLPSGVYLVTIVNNQGQKAVRKMIKR